MARGHNNRKRQAKRGNTKYRNQIARPIQMANMKPASTLVRFQGQQRYTVGAVTGANGKSILTIPVSYLGEPTVNGGGWVPQDTSDFYNSSYSNWYQKYNHYKIMGMKVTATVKPTDNSGQDYNQVLMIRTATQNPYSSSSMNKDLEQSYGSRKATWSYVGLNNTSGRVSQGYSPKKQLGIKDVADNSNLRASTTYDTGASENTFIQIILAGVLDVPTQGHPNAIVDVRCDAILHFEEPVSGDNKPANFNFSTM